MELTIGEGLTRVGAAASCCATASERALEEGDAVGGGARAEDDQACDVKAHALVYDRTRRPTLNPELERGYVEQGERAACSVAPAAPASAAT